MHYYELWLLFWLNLKQLVSVLHFCVSTCEISIYPIIPWDSYNSPCLVNTVCHHFYRSEKQNRLEARQGKGNRSSCDNCIRSKLRGPSPQTAGLQCTVSADADVLIFDLSKRVRLVCSESSLPASILFNHQNRSWIVFTNWNSLPT